MIVEDWCEKREREKEDEWTARKEERKRGRERQMNEDSYTDGLEKKEK